MSEAWDDRALLEPIGEASPCGVSLDPSELLTFDAYRVFSQIVPLDAPLERGEQGRTPRPSDSPEWLEIRDKALEALAKSRDLRVLTLLGAALLRIEGPYAFCRTVTIASKWLSDFWDTVYPLALEDTIERQSALSCFGDQFAVVDPLRRAPLVSSRKHGRFSLRDIELGAAQGPIDAAFDELPLEELQRARQRVIDALQAFKRMDARIREADPEVALFLESVSGQLTKLDRVLREQLARRPESGVTSEASAELPGPGAESGPAAPGGGIGAIRTREDAIRALDAVAAFFQQTEPSSPVPLLVERAKRLVSKSFLEVLADIAPGALGEARAASGVKAE
jgi:type VI secretion system protein ImpA